MQVLAQPPPEELVASSPLYATGPGAPPRVLAILVCPTHQLAAQVGVGVGPMTSRGGSPLLESLPNFSGPAGAFRAQSVDAALFSMCRWDDPHQMFRGRCPHVRVAVRGKESTVC
eukprot:1143611-Pelagomonas_calceolata.AAC.6